jgi:hypothetical protein
MGHKIVLVIFLIIFVIDSVNAALTSDQITQAVEKIVQGCPNADIPKVKDFIISQDCGQGETKAIATPASNMGCPVEVNIMYRCINGVHSLNGIDLTTLPSVIKNIQGDNYETHGAFSPLAADGSTINQTVNFNSRETLVGAIFGVIVTVLLEEFIRYLIKKYKKRQYFSIIRKTSHKPY